MAGRILVSGGKGALGSAVVSHFKSKKWWVASIDFHQNEVADLNILVDKNENLKDQQSKVKKSISLALKNDKLDTIICVAGGWMGGNAKNDLIKKTEMLWKQSVWSSLISADIAVDHLKDGGLLLLTGAHSALDSTPKMIGYGMAKSAVHHLAISLAGKDSGMPENSACVAILPMSLDTPMNRKMMPNADFSSWTVLDHLCSLFMDWSVGTRRPPNGSLITIVTRNNETKIIPHQKPMNITKNQMK